MKKPRNDSRERSTSASRSRVVVISVRKLLAVIKNLMTSADKFTIFLGAMRSKACEALLYTRVASTVVVHRSTSIS